MHGVPVSMLEQLLGQILLQEMLGVLLVLEDLQMIEGDVFRIIVKVPEFGSCEEQDKKKDSGEVTGEVTPQATPQVTPQVANMLQVLKGEMNRQELQEALGLKDRFYFRDSYIIPGLKSGVIEMTQPNSPRSPTQRYRLTSKGYEVLNKLKKSFRRRDPP